VCAMCACPRTPQLARLTIIANVPQLKNTQGMRRAPPHCTVVKFRSGWLAAAPAVAGARELRLAAALARAVRADRCVTAKEPAHSVLTTAMLMSIHHGWLGSKHSAVPGAGWKLHVCVEGGEHVERRRRVVVRAACAQMRARSHEPQSRAALQLCVCARAARGARVRGPAQHIASLDAVQPSAGRPAASPHLAHGLLSGVTCQHSGTMEITASARPSSHISGRP
jgi:hypothetical protein